MRTDEKDAPNRVAVDQAADARTARWLAYASIGCLLAMAGITLLTGVSQEEFEVVRTVADYGTRLVAKEPMLRALMAIDSLFLCFYSAFFVVFLGVQRAGLHRASELPLVARLGLGALLGTAFLDLVEDHHILAMARAATLGDLPDAAAIAWQHLESQVKFGLSYAGLLLYGVGLPRRDWVERAFALSIALPLPLLGSVIVAAPPSLGGALALVRLVFFVSGFGGALFVLARRTEA